MIEVYDFQVIRHDVHNCSLLEACSLFILRIRAYQVDALVIYLA